MRHSIKYRRYLAWMEQTSKYKGDECKLFPGSLFGNGYGQFEYQGEVLSHRVMYVMMSGAPVPDGLFVLHSCRKTRTCCTPSHLRLGTHSDNMLDRVVDGTSPSQKLTQEKAKEIRILRADGATICDLAILYKVSYGAIYKVVHNLSWRSA